MQSWSRRRSRSRCRPHCFTVNITAANPGNLPAGGGGFVHRRQLQLRRGPGEQCHGEYGIGHRARGAGRQRHRAGHEHQHRRNIEFLRRLRVLQCAAQLYVGGFYRSTANTGGRDAAGHLTGEPRQCRGNTIPFAQISWTSGGNGDTGAQPFPAGTFVGGTQTIGTIARNQWAESCLTFSYANSNAVAAGTYTGRVTYTLSTP